MAMNPGEGGQAGSCHPSIPQTQISDTGTGTAASTPRTSFVCVPCALSCVLVGFVQRKAVSSFHTEGRTMWMWSGVGGMDLPGTDPTASCPGQVHNVAFAFELMLDGGLKKPKARPEGNTQSE